ncbi:hypothetical protein PUNSTDRAFT_43235 [Punctularia strigosozonata HHB-11173 SS5]|uniref:uncharacterized protein n=1 Tax=Punctularia strigosozonata (strain HHB-11173) TaxID=741275 RepID=UPI0004417972|nr:uncharacterized protein PUNSTDRAFT_43235 [Punctularia strigosozonata HHB-11173 SS5]EIN10261.1 hypothetical protein PUNSTDRAFT_43235 [Punctularia strigosozonata HHB-11173 SS5]
MALDMHPDYAADEAVPLFCSADAVHFGLSPAQFSALRSRSEGFRHLLQDASPPSSATAEAFSCITTAPAPSSSAVLLSEPSAVLSDLFSFVTDHDALPDLTDAPLARLAHLLEAADKYIFRVEAHLLRALLRARLRQCDDVEDARQVYVVAARMDDLPICKEASRIAVLTPGTSAVRGPWTMDTPPSFWPLESHDLSERRDRKLATYPTCIRQAELAARLVCAQAQHTSDPWRFRQSHDFTGLWYRIRARLRQRKFGHLPLGRSRAILDEVLKQSDVLDPHGTPVRGQYFSHFCMPCYVQLVGRLEEELSSLLTEASAMTI